MLACVRALILFALTASTAPAQTDQMDVQEMLKWSQAQFVRYHVVGVHEGKATVSSTGMGFADVKDMVTRAAH